MGVALGEFLGVTIVLFGGASFLMGQAIAQTWRPAFQVVPYSLLLALSNRFFSYALFEGDLTSFAVFILDWAALGALAAFGFRLTQARLMTRQYPWLYEPDGLLGWRDRRPSANSATGSPDRSRT
jgi:hypothetical protein